MYIIFLIQPSSDNLEPREREGSTVTTPTHSYTKTDYVQTPGKQMQKATGLGMNREMARKSP